MPEQFKDNTQGDRLASATTQSYKCSKCGNMYPLSQSDCDVCGFHCDQSSCDVVAGSTEDF
jgi:hypothetical protein